MPNSHKGTIEEASVVWCGKNYPICLAYRVSLRDTFSLCKLQNPLWKKKKKTIEHWIKVFQML